MLPHRIRPWLRHTATITTLAAAVLLAAPVSAHEPAIEIGFPQDPALTEFDSTYGASRPGGRSHQGNDLMAPQMTPVYAVLDGVITTMKFGPLSGYMIIIEHRDGWESYYMHLNDDTPGSDDGDAVEFQTYASGLEVGDLVLEGDLIGYVGDSGNAEGSSPHNHFELHHGGHSVNPYPFLVPAQIRAIALLAEQPVTALEGRAS